MENITIEDAIVLFKAQVEILHKYSIIAEFEIDRIAHIKSPPTPNLEALLPMQEQIRAAFKDYPKVEFDLWYSFWPKGRLVVWR